ncbi:MAG: hypothetical protein WCA91_19855 [Candidatus Acidiferrales bacterium]
MSDSAKSDTINTHVVIAGAGPVCAKRYIRRQPVRREWQVVNMGTQKFLQGFIQACAAWVTANPNHDLQYHG